MTDLNNMLPSTSRRHRRVDSDLQVIILHSSFEAGREIAGRLADASDQQVRFHGLAVDGVDSLVSEIDRLNPQAVLVEDQSVSADDVVSLMRRFGALTFLVLTRSDKLADQVDWVHRGIQDVLSCSASAAELGRALRFALERKHLHNDLLEALRLEQESVVQMQSVMDQLVGYATRNTL